MIDPTSFVHAFHATKEVHRGYLRSRDEEEPAERSAAQARANREKRAIAAWLPVLLSIIRGELRVQVTLRHNV